MRISLRAGFRTLVCILSCLILTQPGWAQDGTNAADIQGTDTCTWAGGGTGCPETMDQVMGGNSAMLRGSSTIRGPAGIYAIVLLSTWIKRAQNLACRGHSPPPNCVDHALTDYFGYLLANPAVSGILLVAKWQDLSPGDPGSDPNKPALDSIAFHYVGDVLNAIGASTAPKTLQLVVTPGFNSPSWLFDELTSCDGLFMLRREAPSSCGYTNFFQETESGGAPTYLPLPLPWNPTYKNKWQIFLQALNNYIMSSPYASSFVSIAVAGPTASSEEIILPNEKNNPGPLNPSPLPRPHNPFISVTVLEAWNCLLGNNYGISGDCLFDGYGATSDYVNSDRAFIEEWAYAIDMYGAIFNGVTLTVSTGNGLPNFPVSSSSPFLNPPPAFVPDCLPNSNLSATPTMDCSAETAILAYFAGPPVGGANAKATQEDGLTARGIYDTPLSGSSVKWLAQNTQNTTVALSVLNSTSGNGAVVSRMLGGLQLAKPFSTPSSTSYEGCEAGTTCSIKPAGALRNVLKAYFQGTSAQSTFPPPASHSAAMNGAEVVMNAPINYLQIWDTDILYASGLSVCSFQQLMTKPGSMGIPPKCDVSPTADMRTVQDLLNNASNAILNQTQEAVTSPPFCGCNEEGYGPRNAFEGDNVCVDQTQQSQAMTDNGNANGSATGTYAMDYTDRFFVPPYLATRPPAVPYGICKSGYTYRRAYMGDYVCTAYASQVAADNAAFPSRAVTPCPALLPSSR